LPYLGYFNAIFEVIKGTKNLTLTLEQLKIN